jgi:hypothetical protein
MRKRRKDKTREEEEDHENFKYLKSLCFFSPLDFQSHANNNSHNDDSVNREKSFLSFAD